MGFYDLINSLVDEKLSDSQHLNSETAFSELYTEYLQEGSLIPEYQHSYFYKSEQNNKTTKINGFCLNESEDIISVFISDYSLSDEETSLNLESVKGLFKQLYRAFTSIIKVNSVNVPKSHILYELYTEYSTVLKNNIFQVDLYLLTNKNAVNRKDIDEKSILSKGDIDSDIDFGFKIIDLKEIERLHKNNGTLDIDVSLFYDKPIEILNPNLGASSYGTAIAIFPGEFLYNIYKEFGARLLESNVRSFLSSNVKVNKGIKTTLVKNPEMFLAYNNGLCVTVSNIETNEDGTVKVFNNFQIVNGGQTTSSIYFSKKKDKNVNLDKVNVMAKITEIRRNIDSSKIQTTIAMNSNLQNAVKKSDLSSNEEFLINLHALSKKYRSPFQNAYYYFERTRGQYKLERDLSKNQSHFLKLYPKSNVIDKAMLSILYFCAYRKDISPFISVQSAEKRYHILNEQMDIENTLLNEEYYINVVGSFILYNSLKRIYGSGNNAIGKIRKNVLAYSISIIQKKLLDSNNMIDFKSIWRKGITKNSELGLKHFLGYINELLLENLDDGRLDEACKKETSWSIILKSINSYEVLKVIELLPQVKYKKAVKVKINDSIDTHELMIQEMNRNIHSLGRYKAFDKRISDEIETHSSDKMSLYSRRHKGMMKEHFMPNGYTSRYSPKTYSLYLLKCQNKSGGINKVKLNELKLEIRELHRVYSAIISDELLNLDNVEELNVSDKGENKKDKELSITKNSNNNLFIETDLIDSKISTDKDYEKISYHKDNRCYVKRIVQQDIDRTPSVSVDAALNFFDYNGSTLVIDVSIENKQFSFEIDKRNTRNEYRMYIRPLRSELKYSKDDLLIFSKEGGTYKIDVIKPMSKYFKVYDELQKLLGNNQHVTIKDKPILD